jgi:hypothetical protein
MEKKAIYSSSLLILAVIISCQNIDDSEEIDAITKVIIAEGEARQNNDFKLFSECWAHEPYILNYAAINWGCHTFRGWDEMLVYFKESHQGDPDPKLDIRRENINIHINGNIALADFDLFIDNFPGGDLESKANATLEKINDSWKIIYLNVIFDKSFNQKKKK